MSSLNRLFEQRKRTVFLIRKRLTEEFNKDVTLYDESYYKLFMKSDFQVERFAFMKNYDMDDSYELIKQSMLWYKESQVGQLAAISFPKEFYEVGGLFQYGSDKDGIPLLYFRIKLHRKIAELEKYLKQFLVYHVNRIDAETLPKGQPYTWALVFDCTDTGLGSLDFDTLFYLISLLKNYYPRGIKYAMIYNLPWMLSWLKKVGMAMVPADAANYVKFCDSTNVSEFIPINNLPEFMGGNCKKPYNVAPLGCRSGLDVAVNDYQLDPDLVERIFEQYTQIIDDAVNKNDD